LYQLKHYCRSGADKLALKAYKALPVMLDGGCNVVTVRYSLRAHRIEPALCNGDA
jgi:hypothetical protein